MLIQAAKGLLNSGAEQSEALAGAGVGPRARAGGGAPARNQVMLTERQ
jgi:hypothetical protein